MEDAKEGSIIHLKNDRTMAKTASNWYVSEEMWERDVKEGERPWMKGHKMRSKAQLGARLKKLRDENKIVLSDEAFMALLIVSSTESSGFLQTINSYDSDVMSMGFVQFTMTGKLQKLIAENEAAFKKHGIELSQSRETIKYRRGKKIMGTGLKGTADIQELRNPYWAAKFYEAGMDDDIIKAQVEEFKKHFQDFKRRKLKKGTDASNTSLVAHFASAEVTGILMEFNNNRPAYVKSVIETVLEEFGDREEITRDEFLSVLKEKMIAKYVREEGNTEKIRRKGKNIVEKGHAMYEASRDLMED